MVKRFLSEESITISEEIKGVKTLITEKEKARDFLEKESFLAMQDAEKKMILVFSRKLML